MNPVAVLLEQIKASKQPVTWNWQSHAYKAVKSGMLRESFGNHQGTLIFRLRNLKKHIAISLVNDSYTIHFGSLRKGAFRAERSQPQVLAHQIIGVINNELGIKS